MSDNKFPDFERLNIEPLPLDLHPDIRFIESEWMVCVDGANKTACEVHRKTGEKRAYDYTKAMDALHG